MGKDHFDILNHYSEDLTLEMLRETADRFFGARKEIDEMKETLDRYVADLREMGKKPLKQLAVLKALVLDQKERMDAFWEAIGIPARAFDMDTSTITLKDTDFPHIRKGWTLKGKYTGIVLQTYSELYEACDSYRHCRPANVSQKDEAPAPCYDMVLAMANLLNEKIRSVNDTFSMECTLQFVRSLDVRSQEAEDVTGGIHGRYSAGLLDNLCISPVDIESLSLPAIPVPPSPDTVERKIRKFCGEQIRLNRDAITNLMDRIAAAKNHPR
ncbi:hypothetical protein [Desulfatirhabdium butyrativorans]|uniref:hypothetical protein n=1 Tax=Desulfatirhabdium butyrativorans TaxID=340467 RepID=UPI000400CAA4|nr:hypothetical protein [Desulfatirhabdium butyrativorans]